MNSEIRIALLSKDAETVKTVSSALVASPEIQLNGTYPNLQQLVRHLEKTQVPAALVDIEDNPAEMLPALAPVIARFPKTRFIVLSDGLRNDVVMKAMEIGARYFLLKESVPSTLIDILRRLVIDITLHNGRRGFVTTVLSAGGGCGSTTVAVNLANEIQLQSGEPALLVDLDCAYGAVATHLGIRGRYSIADVLTHNEAIDPALVRSSALAYSEGLHVLISPASVNFENPLNLHLENLPKAIEACKQSYTHTVVDAPRVSMDTAAGLAGESMITIICFQSTVKDVRLVHSIFSALTERGVNASSILPLANRYRKRGSMLSMEEIRQALGDLPIEQAANDYKSAMKGVNYGQPLAEVAPRSLLRKDLRRIVVRIDKIAAPSLTQGAHHGS